MDLVTFTAEIHNGKLHFLCSVIVTALLCRLIKNWNIKFWQDKSEIQLLHFYVRFDNFSVFLFHVCIYRCCESIIAVMFIIGCLLEISHHDRTNVVVISCFLYFMFCILLCLVVLIIIISLAIDTKMKFNKNSWWNNPTQQHLVVNSICS